MHGGIGGSGVAEASATAVDEPVSDACTHSHVRRAAAPNSREKKKEMGEEQRVDRGGDKKGTEKREINVLYRRRRSPLPWAIRDAHSRSEAVKGRGEVSFLHLHPHPTQSVTARCMSERPATSRGAQTAAAFPRRPRCPSLASGAPPAPQCATASPTSRTVR